MGREVGRAFGLRSWLRLCASAVALLAVASEPARAAQAILVADTHVNSVLPAANSGAISNLNVGGGYTTLLQFDLSLLPAGTTAAQISRAVLRLYVNRVTTPGLVAYAPINGAWGEYSVTYATEPAIGAPAGVFSASQAGAFVAIDVTSLVQGWITNPATNNGVALSAGTAVVQFDSKENDQTAHAATLDVDLSTTGPTGAPGATGLQGPTGFQGPAGSTGAMGTSGPQGLIGPIGSAGLAGAAGAVGAAGKTGAAGPTGTIGLQGPIGATGLTGPQGPAGANGTAGTQGAADLVYQGNYSSTINYALGDVVLWQGSSYTSLVASNHGNTPSLNLSQWGMLAAAGSIGITGTTGASGSQGPQGPPGSLGLNGPAGPQGSQGIPGQAGAQGIPGATGTTGLSGPMGPQGVPGPEGLAFQGVYSSTTNYALADGVSYNGSGYVSLVASNHGNTPSQSPQQWALLAAAGAMGTTGPTGPTGATGQIGLQGPQGQLGANGATGATGPQGPAVANFLGTYQSSTNYALHDAVNWQGSTYVSLINANHGNTPSLNPSQWAMLAAQGPAGAIGVAGTPGPTGAAGSTGVSGAIGPQGPPVAFQGQWLIGTSYAIGDSVSYSGSSYIALIANIGREPDASPLQWGLLAAAGAPGPAGTTGVEVAAYAAGAASVAIALAPVGANLFDRNRITANCLISLGGGSNSQALNFCTGFVPVAGLSQITFASPSGNPDYFGYAFYDALQNFVSGGTSAGATMTESVPAGAAYFRAGYVNSLLNTLMIVSGSSYPATNSAVGYDSPTVEATNTQNAIKAARPLNNAVMGVFGDSISSIFGNAWQNVVIARTGVLLNFQDARPGRGISQIFECYGATTPGAALNTYNATNSSGNCAVYGDTGATIGNTLAQNLANVQLLVIQDGTNDQGVCSSTCGALGDATNSGTYYGSLRWVLETLLAANHTMHIVWIGPQDNGEGTHAQTQAVIAAQQAECALYGIPYLNLSAIGGGSAFNDSWYTNGDLTHPSIDTFQNSYGPAVAQFLIAGASGAAGANGVTGATGVAGPQGSAGPIGLTGPTGASGATGANGIPGTNGTLGTNGAPGPPGMTFKGVWLPAYGYAATDSVTYGTPASTYIALASNSSSQPDRYSQIWAVLAQAGGAGPTGAAGTAAAITIGTISTGAAGTQAAVTNTGTATAAILDFTIPQGATGPAGTGGNGGGSTSGIPFASVYHLAPPGGSPGLTPEYYSVNNSTANPTESAQLLTWVPTGCTVTGLNVYSQLTMPTTLTLRSFATPGGVAAILLTCTVTAGPSSTPCTVPSGTQVTAGHFIDYSMISENGPASPAIWTALACN